MHKQLMRISELKQQLITSGYHEGQVNNIVREIIGTVSLPNSTIDQNCELIETLEYYCDFAVKCKKGIVKSAE